MEEGQATNNNMGTFLDHLQRLGSHGGLSDSAGGVPEGGQSYPCGTGAATVAWCNNEEVRKAIHMHPQSFYGRPWSLQAGPGMKYSTYTGASCKPTFVLCSFVF